MPDPKIRIINCSQVEVSDIQEPWNLGESLFVKTHVYHGLLDNKNLGNFVISVPRFYEADIARTHIGQESAGEPPARN